MKRAQTPRGNWQDLEYCIAQAELLIKKHHLDRLPGANTLNDLGYGGLRAAISRYHGGYRKFRAQLGEDISAPWEDLNAMTDEQFLTYLKRKFKGKTPEEINRTDSRVITFMYHRKLSRKAYARGILSRTKREAKTLKNLTLRQAVAEISDKYKGSTIAALETTDSSLLNAIRKKEYLEVLLQRGLLVREAKAAGYFSQASDHDLMAYTKKHYRGRSISDVERKDGETALIRELRDRGLMASVVEKRILRRLARRKHSLQNMSDTTFVNYMRKEHAGKTRSEIAQTDKTVYREMKRRELDALLVRRGILLEAEERFSYGYFTRMSGDELVDFLNAHCAGWPINKVQKHFYRVYDLIRKKGLLPRIYKAGILVPQHYSKYAQDKTDQLAQIRADLIASRLASLATVTEDVGSVAEMLVQLWPDRFPSAAELALSLPGAINRIGHSLHPFTMEKARGLYEDTKTVSKKVKYALDELLLKIAIEQHQVPFNRNPARTLRELTKWSRKKNGIRSLAERTLKYYETVYSFQIPGQGSLKERYR